VRFYCILLRAHFNLEELDDAENFYKEATTSINLHLGVRHPLLITLHGIYAYLFVSKQRWKEAEITYQTSMVCCIKGLGPNHAQTAQLHMDFGLFYLKKPNSREKALAHFEQAYMIYHSYFEKNDGLPGSEILADAAI
jgi:tetratricopeptide (TPR) repeat protein